MLYDLAFLLMDLRPARPRRSRQRGVQRVAGPMPETDGLRVLPLFLALRAATRSYALAGGAHAPDPRQAAQLAGAGATPCSGQPSTSCGHRHPMLVLLGGDDCRRPAELAAAGGRVPPAPGARILRLAHAEDASWREAGDVLAAGCSVVHRRLFRGCHCRQAPRIGHRASVCVPARPVFSGHGPGAALADASIAAEELTQLASCRACLRGGQAVLVRWRID